jgi:triacylglycerol esterase/lipase EstA (alpha/beta hydrolase family)
MTWQAPVTWTTNQTVTAAQLNAQLRDNMLETPAAKATTAGYHFASTGVNSIAERAIVAANVDTQQTTTSATYVDLATAGPSVTLTTGTQALIWIGAQLGNSSTGQSYASYGVSGASTLAPSDNISIAAEGTAGALPRVGACDLRALTAGSNTFYVQYRATSATLTALRRRIQVMGL